MGGGEMQLIAPSSDAEGAQMSYLVGKPQMSFFKSVYRRHSNFAMESIQESFYSAPPLDQASRVTASCVFSGRRADMLKDVYLSFELPAIYSDDVLRFRWIENLAHYLVYRATVTLDSGRAIDELYGEWMDIWNELTVSDGRRGLLNRMTGNVPEWTEPVANNPRVIVRNNLMQYRYYPTATPGVGTPSIVGRRVYVPLRFWFTRPGFSLPLCAVRFQTLTINLELRALEELYQLYDPTTNRYVSPSEFRSRPGNAGVNVNISRFLAPALAGRDAIDLNPYLECNYIFLDNAERIQMTLQHHQILMEQTFRFSQLGIRSNEIVTMPLNNPVKEFVWIFRRADVGRTNTWSTFTDDGAPILSKAKLVWNKNYDRIQEKPGEYFQYIQPHQHHTSSPRDGIYVYSFALYPEKTQPSGAYNTAIITANQLVVTVNPPAPGVEYECVVYALTYNIFEALGGVGQLKFTP
jgi:hypothetical protein